MMAAVLSRFIPSSSPNKYFRNALEETAQPSNTESHMVNSNIDLDVEGTEPDEGTEEETEQAASTHEAEDIEEDEDVDEAGEASDNRTDDSSNSDSDEDVATDARANRAGESRRHVKIPEVAVVDDSGSEAADDSSDQSSGEEEAPWDAESYGEVEAETETADPNCCIFCKQPEDQDPSEEFELYLACRVCGDNAHRQCARAANSLMSDADAENWRCPKCTEHDLDPDPVERSLGRRRSSAPKIARDLLPAQKALKAGSHSVFNTLILDDDPMDGSRSLRKRKFSNEADLRPESRKRQRRASSEIVVLQNRHEGPHASEARIQTREEATPPSAQSPTADATSRARPSRLRQQKRIERPRVLVIENSDDTLVLSISLDPSKLRLLKEDSNRKRRRERDRARRARRAEEHQDHVVEVSHYPALQSSSFTLPFYGLSEREGEATKPKPYGGILTEAEADNTRTFPQLSDRNRFENARLRAEEEWRRKVELSAELARPSQKVSGPPSRIKCISFGRYEIDTWHAAPYPEEYSRNRVLYICEFCLKYMNSDFVAWRHKLKCPARHPPGDEIYQDGQFSFFEVDGRKNPVYCQNLCLLAKLFLGSKTLYYDVEPFLFYVMTENTDEGCHFVGYFSKEKRPSSLNNVSCILVLPVHQRRGFGHMLIDFSYLLTKVEGKTGSPEKPLSDMGLVSYRNYWRRVLCSHLVDQKEAISISDISDNTGMTADDIICALEGLRALVKDPVTKTYALRLDFPYFKQYVDNYEKKGYPKINPEALVWVPYVMGRDNSHYENAPHIQTVAQRDEDPGASVPEEGVQLAANGISAKDFTGSKSGGSVADMPTPYDESEEQPQEGATTPVPTFDSDASRQQSPSRRSQTTGNPSTPYVSTPKLEGSPIPPSRFEIFPPLPGTSHRKRQGRPSGRSGSRRGTPLRVPQTANTPETVIRPASIRTRSKLAEMVNGEATSEPSEPSEAPQTGEGHMVDHEKSSKVEEKAPAPAPMKTPAISVVV